jgi:hypothetical protein
MIDHASFPAALVRMDASPVLNDNRLRAANGPLNECIVMRMRERP